MCDKEGNLWQYEAVNDAWINRGTLDSPPTVTEERNGLVTPDVFDRIELLKTATNSGRSLPEELKISPHTSVYWYLFHSSDKLIRFTPEGPSELRLEVDVGRLFTLIAGSACRGPKGMPGEKGLRGANGNPGGSEPCFEPSSITENGTRLNFDITVPAPLSTDISIRLASSPTSQPVVIVMMPPNGPARLETFDATIPLDRTRTLASISYNIGTQRLIGSFIRTTGAWSEHCILARQKGPIGDKGDPGTCILQTNECEVTYTDIQFTSPIIAIRKGCNSNQLLTMSANLFGKVCVSKLAFNAGSPDYANLFSGSFVNGRGLAARKTLEACKDIAVFKPDLQVADRPKLELPEWQPQNDCNVAKRAQQSDLNWIPGTDKPAAATTWGTPTGTTSQKYPWQIMVPKASDAGECDPCEETSSKEPPCPNNQTTTTTTTAPTQFQLRSHTNGSCSCVTSSTPLGSGDVVLNSYSSLSLCQQGQANICGGNNDTQYQLRKSAVTGQCACLNANDQLANGDVVLATYDTLQECETQRNLNQACSGSADLSLWYGIDNACYCQAVGTPPITVEDVLLNAYVEQHQCSDFCMPDPNGGLVVQTCVDSQTSTWNQFTIGEISYKAGGLDRFLGLNFNGLNGTWTVLDEDHMRYTFTLGLSPNCRPQLTVTLPDNSTIVLTGTIEYSGIVAYVIFDGSAYSNLSFNTLQMFGKVQ